MSLRGLLALSCICISATLSVLRLNQCRRITEALLFRDFHVSLEIPNDRLCPPVRVRLNYILWLEDILQAARLAEPLDTPPEAVTGIDVGTGASAIYPLLGCRSNPSWNFVATDVDEKSLHHARLNVQQNCLQERISVIASDPAGPILLHLFNLENRIRDPRAKYDFTMCNPPFYSSRKDVLHSAEVKEFEPTAVCTGADVEMITPGGEANFVCTMVRESLETRAQCRWYTSMLGKLASLTDVVALLRAETIDNYACTEFVQGQTRRWAIAWSFGDVRLPDVRFRPRVCLRKFRPLASTPTAYIPHQQPRSPKPHATAQHAPAGFSRGVLHGAPRDSPCTRLVRY
ncbi:hypothetical protein IEO21_01910 [Rhodonia placenta]|uniref:U6 small nuclear RNA (adenine-(43)-N(6))-methyltransferase n=1 Tax=Rhodonia placenta TaxID=104341 RepID=A0A8H7U5H0_9APHY|nr:hypothetical protein IEO21_01910 [Postia placenta]